MPYKFVSFGGYRNREHRLIAMLALGRELSPDEHVHHINSDIYDNSPENLEVISAVEHQLLHHKGKPLGKRSKPMSDKQRAQISAYQKGRPKSPEAVEKTRLSKIGKKRPEHVASMLRLQAFSAAMKRWYGDK